MRTQMPRLTTLLRSQDPVLIEAVQQAAEGVADLCLETAATIEDVWTRLAANDVVLLLLHLPSEAEVDACAGLLRGAVAAKRPVATLVLSDRHRPEDALQVLRLGAAVW